MSLQWKEISWELDGARANIVCHRFQQVAVKTLLITLPRLAISLNSREGFKGVKFVANNFAPPQLWDFLHKDEHSRIYEESILRELGVPGSQIALIGTGVDVENFSLAEDEFEEFRVCVFVTAGVKSNAIRVGVDKAGYVERGGKFIRLGTINTIILTNTEFSEAAMVRSIVTATEAKTIALQDLKVKSSYSPKLQATGTSSDNIVIVSGRGSRINSVSERHCSKIGELLARAVSRATKEAILKTRRHFRLESRIKQKIGE